MNCPYERLQFNAFLHRRPIRGDDEVLAAACTSQPILPWFEAILSLGGDGELAEFLHEVLKTSDQIAGANPLIQRGLLKIHDSGR